jgi:hypothetical protein
VIVALLPSFVFLPLAFNSFPAVVLLAVPAFGAVTLF